MKFTISWLKKFLSTDATVEQIVVALNNVGLEVEEVIDQAAIYQDFIVAEIISVSKHPEADKLQICQVNNGNEIIQIVCGAANARAGIKVVLASIGTKIPANGMLIKQSKIRNIASFGMLCSAAELALSEESDGILELDSIFANGTKLPKALGLEQVLIDIAITPNRGDCLGVYGIARDLAAAGIGSLKPLEISNISGEFASPIEVEIEDYDNCPKYIGRYFKDLNNCQSPNWLKEDLKSVGIKSISALVDITNYFSHSFARPMHVFDADLLSGDKLCVKPADDNISFTDLNNKTYQLTHDNLAIYDQEKPVALAGIIGGKNSAVSENTRNIFLEIAAFSQDSIIKTGRALQIESDARYRFERNTDSEFMENAMNLASKMILNICSGKASNIILLKSSEYQPKFINFALDEIKKRLGVAFARNQVVSILQNLGFIFQDQGDVLTLQVPSWRHDIKEKNDVIEEVARIAGYDKINSITLPLNNKSNSMLDQSQRNSYRLSRIAASIGLTELMTWSFINADKAKYFTDLKSELFLKNPISSELNYMRPSIIPSLLEAAEKNQNRDVSSLAVFEQATVFLGVKPEEQIACIAGIRYGFNNHRNHYGEKRFLDVFDAKSDLQTLIKEMDFDPEKLKLTIIDLPKYYHPGRAAALTLGRTIIAYFGEIHPKIVKLYNLNHRPVGFELFIDKIPKGKPKFARKGVYLASDFQAVERDFAFIFKDNIAIGDVVRVISKIDEKLIKNVNIFDIYRGKGIELDEKSIAIGVTIQADDRTLTELEIDQISSSIIAKVTDEYNAKLRS